MQFWRVEDFGLINRSLYHGRIVRHYERDGYMISKLITDSIMCVFPFEIFGAYLFPRD